MHFDILYDIYCSFFLPKCKKETRRRFKSKASCKNDLHKKDHVKNEKATFINRIMHFLATFYRKNLAF